MRKFVKVKLEVPGFHYWKNAPDKVSFLRLLHRHLFKIEVIVEVVHGNRDVEFFILQSDITPFFANFETLGCAIDFGQRSCEQIAEELFNFLVKQKYKVEQVEISEDGENSGFVMC